MRADFSRFVVPYLSGLPEAPDVLEIACGMGRFTKLLMEMAGTLHAIDLQKICVNHCKQLFADNENFSASVTDGKTLPSGTFDMIVSYDSLVHADFDVLQHYFTQAQERLRDGGCVIIHHANRPDPTCSRFCVTANMVKEFIETLPDISLVSQTLFRYSERRFVDCVTVCRKQETGSVTPYSFVSSNLFVRNSNKWSVIAGVDNTNILHPNSIGAAPLSVLARNVDVKGKSSIGIKAVAHNESEDNPGARIAVVLLSGGRVLSETELDLLPREPAEITVQVPSGIESLDIEIVAMNRAGSRTNKCAAIELAPLSFIDC